MPDSSVIMGFDFGTKHIGVAVGQTLTKTAQALTSLPAKRGLPAWEQCDKLINEWRPVAFVVGVPLNMDGTEQATTHAARAFANQLKKRYQLPVHPIDERLTTREAKERLFEEGGYKALNKEAIDSLSAKIILEDWLRVCIIGE